MQVDRESLSSLEVVNLKPGDILVFSFRESLNQEQREGLARAWEQQPCFSGIEMIVIDGGATISVLRPALHQCLILQHGDMSECKSCGVRWDTNDPNPPSCQKEKA